MALDPQDFQRRRHQRQQQRRQQEKKRRRRLLGMALGAAALILCIIVLLVAGGKENVEPTVVSATTASEGTQLSSTGPTKAPDTVIHLAAAGDLNVTQGVVDSATGNYDYTETFMDVTPVLAQADITVMNFEGSFYGTPYGADRSAPPSLATALANSGVDILQLANSYSIYKGMDGLAATVSTIRDAGITPVGVHANAQEAKKNPPYVIREVQGIKIAFVAFTKGMNGMALPAGNENCVNLLYTDYASDYQHINTEGITAVLSEVAGEKPDLVVAMLHWGSEFNNTVSKTQEEICQLLQDNGVDAIIGTHSHYVQQMKLDPETGHFVAYSLGDFVGDAPRAGTEYSVILDLEITKDGTTGETKITNFSYTPIFTLREEGKPLRVVRIASAMAAYDNMYIDRVSQSTYDAMKYALERIAARIKGE